MKIFRHFSDHVKVITIVSVQLNNANKMFEIKKNAFEIPLKIYFNRKNALLRKKKCSFCLYKSSIVKNVRLKLTNRPNNTLTFI